LHVISCAILSDFVTKWGLAQGHCGTIPCRRICDLEMISTRGCQAPRSHPRAAGSERHEQARRVLAREFFTLPMFTAPATKPTPGWNWRAVFSSRRERRSGRGLQAGVLRWASDRLAKKAPLTKAQVPRENRSGTIRSAVGGRLGDIECRF